MKKSLYIWFLLALFMIFISPAHADHVKKFAVDKVKGDLSVMVLGSGGPVATSSGRASAGYLIFVEGQPRILMDVGGGTFQRLAKSGVNVKDLELILLSHLHIDHTGDLSPVIKTIYFHNRGAGTFRTEPIHFIGPATNNIPFPAAVLPDAGSTPQYPDSSIYIDQHFDLNAGMERYLHIFSRAISGGVFNFTREDVSPDLNAPMKIVYDQDGLVVKTIAVTHGPVPALAFRVEYKGKSIVYSGDTNSITDNMITLAQDADLLIYDTAIMDDLTNGPNDAVFFTLHTTPTRLGEVAATARPKKLLLSHITPVTEPRLKTVKKIIRQQGYYRKIMVARDLQVINLLNKKHH